MLPYSQYPYFWGIIYVIAHVDEHPVGGRENNTSQRHNDSVETLNASTGTLDSVSTTCETLNTSTGTLDSISTTDELKYLCSRKLALIKELQDLNMDSLTEYDEECTMNSSHFTDDQVPEV